MTLVEVKSADLLGNVLHPVTPRNIVRGSNIAGGGATNTTRQSPDTGGNCSIYAKAYQNEHIQIPLVFRLDTDSVIQFVQVKVQRNGVDIYTHPIVGGGNGANRRVAYPIDYLDTGITSDGYCTYSYQFMNNNSVGLIYGEATSGIVLEAI